MKRAILIYLMLIWLPLKAQNGASSYKEGEFLKYKVHYGLLNAGFTSLEIRETEEPEVLHAVGKGWTTGVVSVFFKVDDNYETYFERNSVRPRHFIRKVYEGGYTKDKEIFFDFKKHMARVIDHKRKRDSTYFIQNNVQDMLSSFYFVRTLDFENLKQNDSIDVNMFMDEQMYNIRVLIMGREPVKTEFGRIDCIKIRPLVLEGRVFKDEENVTLWISDDQNKIPIKIKASILVGSVKADLVEARGLAHPFALKI